MSSTIRQVAEEFGLTLRALRFYEERGLIKPWGRNGRVRLYDKANKMLIARIVEASGYGFTIEEMKSIIVIRGKDYVLNISKEMAQQKIEMLSNRIEKDRTAISHLLELG